MVMLYAGHDTYEVLKQLKTLKEKIGDSAPFIWDERHLIGVLIGQAEMILEQKSPVKVGDYVVRLEDGKHFKIIYVNTEVNRGGVFTAENQLGIKESWGGSLRLLKDGDTFIKIGPREALSVGIARSTNIKLPKD